MTNQNNNGKVLSVALLAVLCLSRPVSAADAPSGAEILRAAGVSRGLIVHLGCGDGRLTADLRVSENCIVHGLDADPHNIQEARDHLRELGVHGPVSVERWQGQRLPYTDNLVNLLVASAKWRVAGDRWHGENNKCQVTVEEIARVLAPNGVALVLADSPPAPVTRDSPLVPRVVTGLAGWAAFVKPWPRGMDEWTHWLHGPNGNAVSSDTAVEISRDLRWVVGPLWARHHDFPPSVSAMVSAGGRIFTIIDEAPAGVTSLPGQWKLVARDAFNGLLLWQQPIPQWGWKHWAQTEVHLFNRQHTPYELTRRLVATGDRVYVTLGFHAPVSELDAETGRIIKTYDQTLGVSEILLYKNRMILSVSRTRPTRKPGEKYEAVGKDIVVLDPRSGRTLWRKGPYVGTLVFPDTFLRHKAGNLFLVTGDDAVFLVDAEHESVVCLDLEDGEERWRAPRPKQTEKSRAGGRCDMLLSSMVTLVFRDGRLYFAQTQGKDNFDGNRDHVVPATVRCIDAATGKTTWQRDVATINCAYTPDLFVTEEALWMFKPGEMTLMSLNPTDGSVMKEIDVTKVLKTRHHARCYRNKATSRFILTGKEGIEYIDLKSGELTTCHWLRGGCRYGIMPANGMIYVTPHPCGCFVNSKLNGFMALAPASGEWRAKSQEQGNTDRLEQGPAYEQIANRQSEIANPNDWPTFRHDNRRSGSTTADLPVELSNVWTTDLHEPPTAPTVVGKHVFVALPGSHQVCCLDNDSGDIRWRYTVGGRVDTPPTFYRGTVLFGCRDGHVYCLTAHDGRLVWRFRAAPSDTRIMAHGRLESAWPVHGSVLMDGGKAVVTAGRSAHLNGGLYLFALDPGTGKSLFEKRFTPNKESAGELAGGLLSDILVSDGRSIWMRGSTLNLEGPGVTDRRKTASSKAPGRDASHIVASGGFLDRSWFNRYFWSCGGARAQYLVHDDRAVYGISAFKVRQHRVMCDAFAPSDKGYELLASNRVDPKKGWHLNIPLRGRAMIATAGHLFIAGEPDVVDSEDPWAAFEGRKGGRLEVRSKETGEKLAKIVLSAAPVYDGMAAAGTRLYVSLSNGQLVCFSDKP
jgi:outer membrane protein assembly factor BamB